MGHSKPPGGCGLYVGLASGWHRADRGCFYGLIIFLRQATTTGSAESTFRTGEGLPTPVTKPAFRTHVASSSSACIFPCVSHLYGRRTTGHESPEACFPRIQGSCLEHLDTYIWSCPAVGSITISWPHFSAAFSGPKVARFLGRGHSWHLISLADDSFRTQDSGVGFEERPDSFFVYFLHGIQHTPCRQSNRSGGYLIV